MNGHHRRAVRDLDRERPPNDGGAAPGTGPPPETSDEERRFRLFLTEFESLREESAQARSAQQSIFQWSVGAFAAVIVASVALRQPNSFWVQAAVFGLGLPILILGAALAWFSELYRMERAGFYLRSRERTWHRGSDHPIDLREPSVGDWLDYPLLWESAIHTIQNRRRDFLTGFLVYGAALSFSQIVFQVHVWGHRFDSGAGSLHAVGGMGMTLALVCGFAWLMWHRFANLERDLPCRHREQASTSPARNSMGAGALSAAR